MKRVRGFQMKREKIKASTVDDRRRVVLPESCPPNSAVTVQELDRDTWLIKRQRASGNYKIVLIPAVQKLPDDPEWDNLEVHFARAAAKKLPAPED